METKPLSTPSITAAQVIAVVTSLVGLFVSQGAIDSEIGKLVVGSASIVIPFGWLIADAIIRHGRAKVAAAHATASPPVPVEMADPDAPPDTLPPNLPRRRDDLRSGDHI